MWKWRRSRSGRLRQAAENTTTDSWSRPATISSSAIGCSNRLQAVRHLM